MGAIDDIKDILRGALASLGGFGGRMLARLVLMLVAGHLYGAASLGLLGQVAALTEIIAAAATMGLKRTLLDLLSGKEAEEQALKIIKEALMAALLAAFLGAFLLAALWPLLFPAPSMPLLLLGAIPSIVIAEVGGAAIRFKRIIRWEVIARCVFEPWGFLLGALTFYYTGLTETGLVAAYAFSCVMAACGILIGLHKVFGARALIGTTFNPTALYRIPLYSLPAGITDMGVMMFRRLDILILSTVAGHDTTGIYYMAQQIVTIPHKIHQLFDPMITPVIARLHHGLKRDVIAAKLAGFCRWTFTLQLALTVPIAIFGDHLMALFGDQFAPGAIVLAFLLFAELMDGSFALTETTLLFARPGLPPRLVSTALAIEILTVAGLASLWGETGAAIAFAIAMSSLALARLFFIKQQLGIRIIGVPFMPPIIIAFLVGGGLLAFRLYVPAFAADVFGLLLPAAICCFLLLVRLKGLTPLDREVVKQLRSGSS